MDALSFGAREQMGLISRLAYADLLREGVALVYRELMEAEVAEQGAEGEREQDPQGAGDPGEGGDVHGRTDLRASRAHR